MRGKNLQGNNATTSHNADVESTNRAFRVAFLSEWFPPEPVGPPVWAVRQLAEQGLLPAVITGKPNYPTGVIPPGYPKFSASLETRDGIRILRCPVFPSHDYSAIKRIASYTSFALSTSLLARGPLRAADATLVFGTPATATLAAMVARRNSGTPYVLWVQDLWPDTVFATGFYSDSRMRDTIWRSINWFVNQSYRQASRIAVISPGMSDALIQRGVPQELVSVVYNWAEEATMRPITAKGEVRRSLGIGPDAVVVMYAGGLNRAQGLETWIDAMALLTRHEDLHLVFVGDGPEKPHLAERAGVAQLRNVHFLDPLPREEIAATIAESDAQIVSLRDDPLFLITIPSKTQAALACAKPILSSAGGDVATIVADSGAGWSSRSTSPEDVAEIMWQAFSLGRAGLGELGKQGLAYYGAHMSEQVGGSRLADLVREVARDPRAQPWGV